MIDAVIFSIGTLKVTWFGVMLASAFFASYITWVFVGRQIGKDSNFAADLLLWIMVSSILGARLAYIVANMDDFALNPIEMLYINQGGLIYYGGFIGGGLGLYVFSRRRKMGFFSLVDFVIIGVPVSHFFGRIGCFLNGCCHGAPYDGVLAVRYPYLSGPWFRQLELGLITRFQRDSLPVHPVQIYEGLFNLVLFAVLLYVYPSYRLKPGRTVGLYLMVYPVGRLCFEFLRGDERSAIGPINIAQALSLALIVSGIIIFLIASRRHESSQASTS